MANSYTEYTAAGSITTSTIYTAPPYLEGRGATDIKVTVDGSLKVQGFHYQLASTAVTFNAGYLPSNGQKIRITRSSSQATRLNDYADASLLTADTLDADANQLFFIAQEALDTASETNLAAATFYSSGTSAPSSATAGDLFFNTATGLLQIYTGSAWESINNRGTKQTFAISTSTTIFAPSTPVDDNTLVFLNGVLLVKGSGSAGDYTTSSTQVTLNTAVSSGVVEVVTFPNATNGTFTSGINVTGTVTADTFKLFRADGTTPSLEISTDSNNDTFITENNADNDGSLKILGAALQLRADDNTLRSRDGNTLFFKAINSGNVNLYHGDGTSRIQTSATGIDVTGTVTATGIALNGNMETDGNITVQNGHELRFEQTDGTESFSIKTSGTTTNLLEQGSGNLNIKGDAVVICGNNTDFQKITCHDEGGVKISSMASGDITDSYMRIKTGDQHTGTRFYCGTDETNVRAEVVSAGLNVNGTVTADGITVDGIPTFNVGADALNVNSTGDSTALNIKTSSTVDSNAPDLQFQRTSLPSGISHTYHRCGEVTFKSKNSGGFDYDYVKMRAKAPDHTEGQETGAFDIFCANGTGNTFGGGGHSQHSFTKDGLDVTGTVTASGGYKSSDGTAGFTGSASASATLTIKNGLIVAVS